MFLRETLNETLAAENVGTLPFRATRLIEIDPFVWFMFSLRPPSYGYTS